MGAQFSKNAAKGETTAAEKPGEAVAASPSKANGQVRKGAANGLLLVSGLSAVFILLLPFSSREGCVWMAFKLITTPSLKQIVAVYGTVFMWDFILNVYV